MEKRTGWSLTILLIIGGGLVFWAGLRTSSPLRGLLLVTWYSISAGVILCPLVVAVRFWRESRDSSLRYLLGLTGIGAVLLSAGLVATYRAGVFNELPERLLLEHGIHLRAGGVTLVALLVCAAVAMRLRSRFSNWWFFVPLGGLVVFVPSVWLMARDWYASENVRSDESSRREYIVEVTDRYYRKGGRYAGRTCFIELGQWPDPRLEGYVWRNPPHCVEPGSCLKVGYRQGRLGDPWLDSVEQTACSQEGATSASVSVRSLKTPQGLICSSASLSSRSNSSRCSPNADRGDVASAAPLHWRHCGWGSARSDSQVFW